MADAAVAPAASVGGRWIARAAAVVVLVLGFLPWANWLPGGWEAPWYDGRLAEWIPGSAIVLGGGIVLAILSRKIRFLWPEGALSSFVARVEGHPRLAVGVLVAGAFALYCVVALQVFSGRPLLIDEIVQVFQAQIFASGRLWLPSTGQPEFFGALHVVDHGGRIYGQFPPGGPALMVPGVLAGAPWLVVPTCGAVAVLVFCWVLPLAEPRPATRIVAALLFALAPFAVFMFGSHMNHGMALAFLLIAVAALAHLAAAPGPRPLLAFVSGLGLGAAATVRPSDALAFALPAAVWFLALATRDRRRWADAFASGAGVALPMLVMFLVNTKMTGSPFLFGYEVMWGKSHGLGFHRAPWGAAHTPGRGFELINLYLLRLQTYLYELPLPSLVPAVIALFLARRLSPVDRYLLAAAGLLLGFYFAYWHDGFYLGPRFVFPLTPILALWTARLPALVRERDGGGFWYRATLFSMTVAFALGATLGVYQRTSQYRGGLVTMRWNAAGAMHDAGVHDALVLVRESWGSQVAARLWGIGVSRPATELLYRNVDTCLLDQAVTRLEADTLRGDAAAEALRPLLADSSRVIKSTFSSDDSERILPGARYSATCIQRIEEDRGGFTLYAPLLLVQAGGNVFARDLHARDSVLLMAYPGRPVYLLKPDSYRVGAAPKFIPLSRDSLVAAWRRPL